MAPNPANPNSETICKARHFGRIGQIRQWCSIGGNGSLPRDSSHSGPMLMSRVGPDSDSATRRNEMRLPIQKHRHHQRENKNGGPCENEKSSLLIALGSRGEPRRIPGSLARSSAPLRKNSQYPVRIQYAGIKQIKKTSNGPDDRDGIRCGSSIAQPKTNQGMFP